uniref:Uncharacterized protein n=1 Tax=Cucumis melo TaxID=3656 RepID=A0A9I9DE30_CUCME
VRRSHRTGRRTGTEAPHGSKEADRQKRRKRRPTVGLRHPCAEVEVLSLVSS